MADFFAVDRGIWDHPKLQSDEPFTKREAWMWLISSAAWKPYRHGIKGQVVMLERGEFCYALRFLERKWGWAKSRVERFLDMLENQDMIRDAHRDGVKVYLISNYNEYQNGAPEKRDGERDEIGTVPGQHRDKEEPINKITKDKPSSLRSDGSAPSKPKTFEPPDWIPKEAWDGFVEMRRSIKATLTGNAAELIVKKLERFRTKGHDPGEVLNESTMNSWKGIFEPKTERMPVHAQRNNPHQSKPNRRDDADEASAIALANYHRSRNGPTVSEAPDESANPGDSPGDRAPGSVEILPPEKSAGDRGGNQCGPEGFGDGLPLAASGSGR